MQSLGSIELLAKEVVQGFITGYHKSPFHGFSVEFAEHRLYNKGESTKHIDWKLFARSNKLFVKQYEEETNLRCRFVIDTSSSMLYPENSDKLNKLEFSAYAAAALSELLKKQRDAFGISYFNEGVAYNSEIKSTSSHQAFLFKELEQTMAAHHEVALKTNISDTLHQVAEQNARRSLIVLFSDMIDTVENQAKLFDALAHLKHNKHEVILMHTLDFDSEIQFEFGAKPIRFVDLETGVELKTQANQVKDAYVAKASEWQNNLKLRCGDLKIDYVEADMKHGFNRVLVSYLMRRQKMR